jgi:hypothetical protein
MTTGTTDLGLLQALRFKGRAAPELLAGAGDLAAVVNALEGLVAAGVAREAKGRYMLTPEGRELLRSRIDEERATVDQVELRAAYDEFDAHNSAVKQLVTDWQLVNGTAPNDHTDAAYDAAIVTRLGELHAGFLPVLERVVGIAPRLDPYPVRFLAALGRVQSGDHTWIARPMIDSYHTVWFEFHEELIGLAGLSRADEAAAGRAE